MHTTKERAIEVVRLLARARLHCASIASSEAFTESEALGLMAEASHLSIPDIDAADNPEDSVARIEDWAGAVRAACDRYHLLRSSRARSASALGSAAVDLEADILRLVERASELMWLIDDTHKP